MKVLPTIDNNSSDCELTVQIYNHCKVRWLFGSNSSLDGEMKWKELAAKSDEAH